MLSYISPLQALWGSSSSSLSVGESSVGEWLQKLGLERYEEGLLHNGWDDLEFLRYVHSHTQIQYIDIRTGMHAVVGEHEDGERSILFLTSFIVFPVISLRRTWRRQECSTPPTSDFCWRASDSSSNRNKLHQTRLVPLLDLEGQISAKLK